MRDANAMQLFILRSPNREIAVKRDAQRVAGGGHNVPEQAKHRYFDAGWLNIIGTYRGLVDEWALYDNCVATPELVA